MTLQARLIILASFILFVAGSSGYAGYQYAQGVHAIKENAALTAMAEERRILSAKLSELDLKHTAALEAARNENIALAAAVAAGTKRLRVAASCPVPSTETTGLGDAAGPELNAAARPTYYALRDGLARQAEQLAACQSILASISPG